MEASAAAGTSLLIGPDGMVPCCPDWDWSDSPVADSAPLAVHWLKTEHETGLALMTVP